jgi:arginyl-tRNA synthetase
MSAAVTATLQPRSAHSLPEDVLHLVSGSISSILSLQTVRLVDLLDEARSRCLASIMERRGADTPADTEAEAQAASAMGYGAVKYADLKNSRLTNYKFSMDDMLSMKGNTAVYLLYAHARIAGIIRKSGRDVHDLVAGGTILLLQPQEVRSSLLGMPHKHACETVLPTLQGLLLPCTSADPSLSPCMAMLVCSQLQQ